MLALALSPSAFVAPLKPHTEGRAAAPVCMLGRRQFATGGALFALGAFADAANAGLGEPRAADQSKIGVSTVEIPKIGKTNGMPALKGPVDTSGWTEPGKCESPLSCWSKYPGGNLRDATCGIGKKCPPAVKTAGKTMSPFGVNEGLGESYVSPAMYPPPPPPPPPPPAPEKKA